MSKTKSEAMLSPLFTWRTAIVESDLTPTERHTALTLSLYMNERGGSAFPGPTRLSNDTGLHLVTVKRTLASLEQKGWLELVKRGGSNRGGTRLANEYRALVPLSTPSTGLPVAEDYPSHLSRLPVVLDAPTGSPVLPQDVKNSSLNKPREVVDEDVDNSAEIARIRETANLLPKAAGE